MNEQTVFVDDGGNEGIPVVFLHSLAGNTGQWQTALNHLRQQNRRVIALDFRGHGQSPLVASGDYSVNALANDVLDALEQLSLSQIVLVGHSMGGAVAMRVAAQRPEQVVGLLLVDAAGDSTQIPEAQVQGLLDALASEAYTAVIQNYWQEILVGATEATRQQVLGDLAKTPQAVVLSAFKSLVRHNPLPDLARYNGRKLLLRTTHSESPFSLHNLLPDLPNKFIDDVSHWLHLDKPHTFHSILDDF